MNNQDIFYLGVAWAFGLVNHWGEIGYPKLPRILGAEIAAPDSDKHARHILDLIGAVKYYNSL